MDRDVYQSLASALAIPVAAVPHFKLLQGRYPGCVHTTYAVQLTDVVVCVIFTMCNPWMICCKKLGILASSLYFPLASFDCRSDCSNTLLMLWPSRALCLGCITMHYSYLTHASKSSSSSRVERRCCIMEKRHAKQADPCIPQIKDNVNGSD